MSYPVQARLVHAHTGHTDAVYSVSGAGEGRFVTAGSEGVVALWQAGTTRDGDALMKGTAGIYTTLAVDGGHMLAAGQLDGGLHFYHLEGRQLLKSAQAHRGSLYDLCELPGRQLAAVGGDGLLTRWSLDTLDCTQSLQVSPVGLRAVALSPDGQMLAVAGQDQQIRLYDAATLSPLYQWTAHEGTVFTLAWHPEGWLVSGGRDARLKAWDVRTPGAPLHDIVAHLFGIHHLTFSADGLWLASGSMDKSLKLWRSSDLKLVKVVDNRRHPAHTSSVNRVLWLPKHPEDVAYSLVTVSDDRQVLEWQVEFGEGV